MFDQLGKIPVKAVYVNSALFFRSAGEMQSIQMAFWHRNDIAH